MSTWQVIQAWTEWSSTPHGLLSHSEGQASTYTQNHSVYVRSLVRYNTTTHLVHQGTSEHIRIFFKCHQVNGSKEMSQRAQIRVTHRGR